MKTPHPWEHLFHTHQWDAGVDQLRLWCWKGTQETNISKKDQLAVWVCAIDNQAPLEVFQALRSFLPWNAWVTAMAIAHAVDHNNTVALTGFGPTGIEMAFDKACEENNSPRALSLCPHVHQHAVNRQFRLACTEKRREQIVDILWPFAQLHCEGSAPLMAAVQDNNTALALRLLPHSNPKDNNSSALAWAAMANNAVLVQALYPLSDAFAAREMLAKMNDNSQALALLDQWLLNDIGSGHVPKRASKI